MPDHRKGLNPSQPKEEVENIRYAIQRSRPYGSEGWVSKAVARFGLESTLRHPWRPARVAKRAPPSPSPQWRRRIYLKHTTTLWYQYAPGCSGSCFGLHLSR